MTKLNLATTSNCLFTHQRPGIPAKARIAGFFFASTPFRSHPIWIRCPYSQERHLNAEGVFPISCRSCFCHYHCSPFVVAFRKDIPKPLAVIALTRTGACMLTIFPRVRPGLRWADICSLYRSSFVDVGLFHNVNHLLTIRAGISYGMSRSADTVGLNINPHCQVNDPSRSLGKSDFLIGTDISRARCRWR